MAVAVAVAAGVGACVWSGIVPLNTSNKWAFSKSVRARAPNLLATGSGSESGLMLGLGRVKVNLDG